MFSVLTSKIFGGLSIALTLLCGILWARGNAWENAAERWKETAGQWKGAYDAQEAAYRAAQDAAKAKALRLKLEQEQRDERNREKHNEALDHALADDRRRTDAYAQRNRVQRQAASDLGPAGGTDLPRPSFGAAVDNGSGDDAVVAIPERDLMICTLNSRRLQNAHDWDAAGKTE
jgi:hypothetical protein